MGNKYTKGLVRFGGGFLLCLLSVLWLLTTPVWADPLDNVTDTLSDDTAGATATHTLVFTTASDIPGSGRIIISFPTGFDISATDLGSNPNSFSLSPDEQDIILTSDDPLPAGSITIQLDSIVNTHEPGYYHITIQTTDSVQEPIDGPTDSVDFSIMVLLFRSVTINDKVYDKTLNATISGYSSSGVDDGHDVSLTGGSALFTSVNAGNNITVNITGLDPDRRRCR